MANNTSDLKELIEGLAHVMVWATNREGTVISAIGGCLRLLGLSQAAVVGTHDTAWGELSRVHREAMMGLGGIDRAPGTAFFRNAHSRMFIICWSPYFDEMKDNQVFTPAGAAVILIDVTTLESATVQRLEEKMDEIIPYVRSLAEAEIDRLEAETDLKKQQSDSLVKSSEKRWIAFSSIGTWLSERVNWFSDKVGYAVSVAATVFALWLANQLGITFPEIKIIPSPSIQIPKIVP